MNPATPRQLLASALLMLATMTSFAQTPPDNRYVGSERDLTRDFTGQSFRSRERTNLAVSDGTASLLGSYDLNGNGRLDRKERARLQADQEKLRAIIRAKFDTDKDGHLNAQERYAIRHDREKIVDSDK